MNLAIVDIGTVERELQEQIDHFTNILDNKEVDKPLQKVFQDMYTIINAYHSIILQLKNSHYINKYPITNYDSKLLLLSEIQSDTFNNLQILSEKLKVPINIIINELMNNFLMNNTLGKEINVIENLNYNYIRKKLLSKKNEITVSNKDFIEIMRSDMSEIDITYNFRDIEILIFKNVSVDEFQENIGKIEYCKTVFLPHNIPKLLIYSKMRNVETIKTYESLNDVYDAIFIFN